jgi:CIC family chloride channel protein
MAHERSGSPSRLTAEISRTYRRLIIRSRATLRGERGLYFVLFVAVGAMGGLAASGFRWLASGFQAVYFAHYGSMIEAAEHLPWYMRIVAPAGGAFLAGLVVQYLLRGARGEGISEIMETVLLKRRNLTVRSAILKPLAALLLMGSGGSVGREGPILSLGGALGTWMAHLLRLTPARRNILIGCGVAAGMAAVYNAPLGASLFVMEIVIGNFAMDVFGPLVAASVTAALVGRALTEPGPIYSIPPFSPASVREYFILGLLGIPCALAGIFFTTIVERVGKILGKVTLHPIVKVTLGGAAVGILGIWLPQVWGNGYESVAQVLNGKFALGWLAAIFAGKMLATSVSIGSGGMGGVMTPTLLVGASFGGAIGSMIHQLAPTFTSEPGAYALVGMAGVLAATTHAPIMATFLVFEMCQDYAMILPIGVCAAASALMSRRWKRESIYAEKLARRGVDLDAAIEESALQAITVEDVLWRDPPTVPPEMPARALMERFLQSHRHLMHVVDSAGQYYGLISIQDMLATSEKTDLAEIVLASHLARSIPSVGPGDPVSLIMERFWFQEFGELPVLRGADPPRFVGVVTRRDILGAFDREVLRRRILTARYRMGPKPASSILPLVGDYGVEEVPVPRSFLGKTLAELALPSTFRLTVLALKRGPMENPEEIIPAPGDRPLEPGDRIVLMGRKVDIASLSRR